ncbi:phage/plasmid primase, P4 family [Pseudonocardia alni]|uniref:phage/plasmid primase, P4 family n=1 Tax=Pseudonocardia alni TaxID=33907 RepID=UPI003407C792
MFDELLERAEEWRAAGLNPMPSTGPNDRSRAAKAPLGDWKEHQEKRMPIGHIRIHLQDNPDRGLGILTGGTTGDDFVECLDIEGRAVELGIWERYTRLLDDSGAGDLLTRVRAGYEETTPSGGVHLMWRCEQIEGNQKLAFDASGKEVTIETRGSGGFVVAAPTPGYVQVHGGPMTIATVTPGEREILLNAARVFDESPTPVNVEATPERHGDGRLGERPGDVFNARMKWSDVLGDWTLMSGDGVGYSTWCRPGKDPSEGASATTNYTGNDTLMCFSTSVTELKTVPTSYSKFAVWAIYQHGGDFRKASRAAADMFGMEAPAGGGRRSTNEFIDPRDGLLAKDLRDAVEAMGPLATDDNGNIYAYEDGFWQPKGDRIVTARVVELMGNSYRWSYSNNIKSMIGSDTPVISDDNIDKGYINTPNGLIDVRSGELKPHRQDVYSTVQIPVEYDPRAECPLFDEWLHQVLPEDAIPFAWEVIGYSLLFDNPLHKAIMIYGPGRNGKGTFIRVIRALLGARNTSAITPQEFGDNRFKAAELVGKLANVVGDVDPRTFKSTETLKQLTGQDAITVERKNGHPFEFTCRATIIASFNAMPRSVDTTDGFFERWLVLPFTRGYFPVGGSSTDTSLSDKLTSASELRGVLRYAVAALGDVLRRQTFTESPSVDHATDAFREHADSMRAFIRDRIEDDPGVKTNRSTLYYEWKKFNEENGTIPGPASTFYQKFEAACKTAIGDHVRVTKNGGNRVFIGVSVAR